MEIKYLDQKEMVFIGYHTKIAQNEGYERCPEFWANEYRMKYARLWETLEPENDVERAILKNSIGMFAICDDHGDNFDYWIAGPYKGEAVPEGLGLFKYKASKWAVFQIKGPLPISLQKTNEFIVGEWYENEGKSRGANLSLMLEMYTIGNPDSNNYESSIWVPVER